MRRRLHVVVICAVVAGCGGDGGGTTDEEAIREVIRLSLTTEDARADCTFRLSSRLIRKTYRTRTRCIEVQADDDEDDPPDEVTFSRIRVDGDAATAAIRLTGGDADGARGELGLVREDGDWRIDAVSVALLRSLVEAGLESETTKQELPAGGRACLSRAFDGLPDAEFRSFAYQLIGDTNEAQRRTLEILADCPGEGGRSLLLDLLVQATVKSLREEGASERVVRCARRTLRAELSDDEVMQIVASEKDATRRLAPLLAPCVSKPELEDEARRAAPGGRDAGDAIDERPARKRAVRG